MAGSGISVSVYLLRATGLTEVQRLFSGGVPLTAGLEGTFVLLPTEGTVPAWFRGLTEHLGQPDAFDVAVRSAAGMVLMARASRHFVITFGHAWQQLEAAWLEPDFGRRVVLETVPPDKIIEVGSEQVFAKFHNARERAPRATSIREFGVEAERDLVGAVEGIPADKIFGKVLRGATSLRMKIALRTLGQVLDKAEELFARDTYRNRYPTIDNLMPVTDATAVGALDHLLDRDLRSGRARAHAVMAAPSFRRGDADHAEAFAFGRRVANPATAPYLQYGTWERHLQKSRQAPSLAAAKSTPVHMIDEAGLIFESRSVYDCLGYEVSHAGDPYVLSSGVWYSANAKFTAMIEQTLSGIPACTMPLPAWNQTQDEDEYNTLCCRGTRYLHFDKKIINFGGGRSKFEFCDFMDPTRRILFFAKITGRSHDSSHLVEQVKRTAELLFSSDSGFRTKLHAAMKKHHPKAPRKWLKTRPRAGDWQLCLVSLGRRKDQLPLFAKCSIARLSRLLDQAGHPLTFASV